MISFEIKIVYQNKNNVKDNAEYFQCSFRYYEGEFPVLVVSDPEIVKKIAIKDFQKFHSRQVRTKNIWLCVNSNPTVSSQIQKDTL